MSDRAEDIQEIEALDQRVDELLADVEATAERIDAAIPEPPGADAAAASGVDDSAAFESVDEVLGEAAPVTADEALQDAAAALERMKEPAAAEPALAETDAAAELEEAMEAVAAETKPAAAAPRMIQSPREPETSGSDFTGPEAITRLDEKLAAKATELTDAAANGDVVDDSETEAAIAAGVEQPTAASANSSAPPPTSVPIGTAAAVAAPVAPAPAAPPAPAASPAVVPVPIAPFAAAPEATPAQATVEAKKARGRKGLGVGAAATAAIRPLADFTLKLKPSTRQTIAYAAVVTLFQAACLWGFLAFKGPPGEPVPTSDPVILLQPGDPSSHDGHKSAAPHGAKKADSHSAAGAHDSHAPKKAASKPKAGAKKDAHADAGHH